MVLIAACGGGRQESPERGRSMPPQRAEAPRAGDDPAEEAPAESDRAPDAGPGVVAVAPGASPVEAGPAPTVAPDAEASPAQRALDAARPVRLPAPPMRRTLARRPTPVHTARLRRVSSRRNRITDEEAWFRTNHLTDPALRSWGRPATLDPSAYPTVSGYRLTEVVPQTDLSILLYRPNRSPAAVASLLVVMTDDAQIRACFDLSQYTGGPGVTEMETTFAWVVGDILYVSNAHRTYASATGGHNAYLSAIDMNQQALLWRSAPLEANARTFAVVGDVVVTGYGFTNEKDDLYVLDRHTGRRLSRHRLDAGPMYIIERGGRIFVRAYDHDYELELIVR